MGKLPLIWAKFGYVECTRPTELEEAMKHHYSLFSGGVDSALAVLKVVTRERDTRISSLFFDYGQKAAWKEEEAVARLIPLIRGFAAPDNVVEDCRKYMIGGTDLFRWSESPILVGRESSGNPDLENRNMILISIAVSIIMSDRKRGKTQGKRQGLIVGFKNEHYDTTREFALGLNRVIGQEDFSIEIIAPLVENDNVVDWRSLAGQIHRIEGAKTILSYAWSCYYPTPEGSVCGRCPPCKSRNRLGAEVERQTKMNGS
jgi:7-cyano-7-deazaguanine synthase in queuosine biosynthesis